MTREELAKTERGGRILYSGNAPAVLRYLNYHGYFAEVIGATSQTLRRDFPQGCFPANAAEPQWLNGTEAHLQPA